MTPTLKVNCSPRAALVQPSWPRPSVVSVMLVIFSHIDSYRLRLSELTLFCARGVGHGANLPNAVSILLCGEFFSFSSQCMGERIGPDDLYEWVKI